MLLKQTGVIITTRKLEIQLADVERPFARARIRRGTISAGYSQDIPSQPMAKKELNKKRQAQEIQPGVLPPILFWDIKFIPARRAMEQAHPVEPTSISVRRPNFLLIVSFILSTKL